ncbi:MAG: outer membrane beta-barrel protein [Deltaproteobacteria bacterium]|nr:outer membrane beta-barrel protein [Deltaproteobacteria bacterium]
MVRKQGIPRAIGALLYFSFVLLPSSAAASDWYLRGTFGYEWSRAADFSDTDCRSTNPPALFGCGKGGDGQPLGSSGDFGHFPLIEAAMGRQISPWLRADISLAYRFHMDYTGNANFLAVGARQPVSAEADSLSGMVNLFFDLAGIAGRPSGRFQPYVGGGIGLAYNRIGKVTFFFPENAGRHKVSVVPSGDRKGFAFMLAVGTGIVLTEHITLDLAYRYFDLGRVGTDPGNMAMDVLPAGIAISDIDAPLRTHGMAAGLRYRF